MSKYIKSFDNASDMRTYLNTAPGKRYYLLKNTSGTPGIGNVPESGKSIVSFYKPHYDYLTFTAQQANSWVRFNNSGWSSAEYSTDGGTTWTNAMGVQVNLSNVGDSVKYRGVITSGNTNMKFYMSGKIAASGSIMSMYNNNPDGDVISITNCFYYMFRGCTSLTQAPELPATTLANACYAYMFYGCSSLTEAPELPATTLANTCYGYMFESCTSLTQAPELPATTLANNCYQNMFYTCSSLTTVPELPATTLASECYSGMFARCILLTSAYIPDVNSIEQNSMNSMFQYCSSLTSAEIAISKNMGNIANWIFSGCTNLNYVKLHTSYWDNSDWLGNAAPTGIVECPTGCNIRLNSSSGVPTGWTKVEY